MLTDARSRVVVAVGYSTTDGVGIELDSDARWTDQLPERLQQEPELRDSHTAAARRRTGCPCPYPAGEALRQQLNAWVRDGGGFDAVVHFDLALRDPTRPTRQRAELNSGDFSHPNAAGYGAMARAVDVQQFRR